MATQSRLVIVLAEHIDLRATKVLADLCEDVGKDGCAHAYIGPFATALRELDRNREACMKTLHPTGQENMTDERGLARRPQAEISPLKQNSLSVQPPGLESIRRILQYNDNIPRLDRRRLLKEERRLLKDVKRAEKMALAKDARIRNLGGQENER